MDKILTRKAAVAGSFYPGKKKALSEMISAFRKDCVKTPKLKGELRGLIVPHAGYIYSGIVAAAGYALLASKKKQPKKIVLVGPSHNAYFLGLARAPSTDWETPLGTVSAGAIEDLCGKSSTVIPSEEAHAKEHCLEVQLPFLQEVMHKAFTIYPVLTGEISPYAAADYLSKAFEDRNAFLIVSSDLSHYLPYDKAKQTDALTNGIIDRLDFDNALKIDACGRTGIRIGMHLAYKLGWKISLADYKTSGDTAGDKDRVVGYGCHAITS